MEIKKSFTMIILLLFCTAVLTSCDQAAELKQGTMDLMEQTLDQARESLDQAQEKIDLLKGTTPEPAENSTPKETTPVENQASEEK